MRTRNAILATSSQLGFAAVVTVSSSQILFSSRHRERGRGRESATGGYQSVLLSWCEECSVCL